MSLPDFLFEVRGEDGAEKVYLQSRLGVMAAGSTLVSAWLMTVSPAASMLGLSLTAAGMMAVLAMLDQARPESHGEPARITPQRIAPVVEEAEMGEPMSAAQAVEALQVLGMGDAAHLIEAAPLTKADVLAGISDIERFLSEVAAS